MNIASSLRKLLDLSKVEDKVINQAKDVYEELMIKNFQIVTSFLQRINEIYQKHTEFEKNFASINERIQQLALVTDNIHYQFRTTHLAIDKKLNEVAIDYLNLKTELKTARIIPSDQIIEQTKMPVGVISINPMRQKFKSKTIQSGHKHPRQNSVFSAGLQTSMVIVDPNIFTEYPQNQNDLQLQSVCQSQANKSINKRVIFAEKKQSEERSSSSEQKQFLAKFKVIDDDGSQKMISINCINEIQKQSQSAISKRFQEIYIELLEKMSTLSKDNEAFKSQINAKISQLPKNDVISSITEKEIALSKEIGIATSQICNLKIRLRDLERNLDKKASKQYFEDSLENLSSALTQELTLAHKKFSNKIATQNAIQFLEKKLNRLIEEVSTAKTNANQEQKSSALYQSSTNKHESFLKVSEYNLRQRSKYQKPKTAIIRDKNFSHGKLLMSKKSLDEQQQPSCFSDLKILDHFDLQEKPKDVSKQTTAGASQIVTPHNSSSFYKKQVKAVDFNIEGCSRVKSIGQMSVQYLNPIPHSKNVNQPKMSSENKQNTITQKIWKEKAMSMLSGVKKKRRKQQFK